jgi:hypothetical protein
MAAVEIDHKELLFSKHNMAHGCIEMDACDQASINLATA